MLDWLPFRDRENGSADKNIEEQTYVLEEPVTIRKVNDTADILGIDPEKWRSNPREVVEEDDFDPDVGTMQRFVEYVVDEEESTDEVPDLETIPYRQAYIFFIVVYSRWSNAFTLNRQLLTSVLNASSTVVGYPNGKDYRTILQD